MGNYFRKSERELVIIGLHMTDKNEDLDDRSLEAFNKFYSIYDKQIGKMPFIARQKYLREGYALAYKRAENEKYTSEAQAFAQIFGHDAYIVVLADKYNLSCRIAGLGKIEVCGEIVDDLDEFRKKLPKLGVKSRDGFIITSWAEVPREKETEDGFEEDSETLPNIDELY